MDRFAERKVKMIVDPEQLRLPMEVKRRLIALVGLRYFFFSSSLLPEKIR
jgi:hypothetical protein